MAHESVVINLVVAIFGLLLIASVSAVGLRRARLPYSVGLVVIGLVLGFLSKSVEGLAFLNDVALSPEVILFVFLPTLIFESAFSLDSRLLSKNLVPVLALAAPGLLLSTALIGGLVALLTPLPLGPALLFGALISATDPVAVVALFKEVGAPRRLTILVESESLFNDATAIVLFRIILAVLVSGIVGIDTIANGVFDFLIVFGGGLLVGSIIGYLMVRSIALADNDPLVEVALSTVVAYAAFIAAEHYLHVSGVMATVGAGIVIGAFGTPRFTPQVRVFLHQFWEYAAFVANGLIFLLVGMSVKLSGLVEHIVPILFTIVTVLIARAAVTFGLLPLVGRLPGSEPINWRYRTVLWWGGLRGAVALALAFSLSHDFPYHDLIVALTVGVVLFSILSGGLSMGRLIGALGLNRPTMVEKVGRAHLDSVAKKEALERISQMATAGHFSNRLIEDMQREYQLSAEAAQNNLTALQAECDFHEIKRALWLETLNIEKTTYRELQDRREISEPVLRELELAVDLQRDLLKGEHFPSTIPTAVPLELRFAGAVMRLIERLWPKSPMARRFRLRSLAAQYEYDSAILEASRRVATKVEHLAELFEDRTAASEVAQEYERRGNEAMDRIDSVGENFPEYVSAVQLQTARRIALDAEADAVKRLVSTGGIPESIAQEASRSVEKAQRQLVRQPVEALEPHPEDLLVRVPFFKNLSNTDFKRVVDKLVPRTVLAGETIIRQGERGNSLFLIARGVVAVLKAAGIENPQRVASLYAGDFFGEMAILTASPRNATVQAVSASQLYELRKRDVDALCKVCPDLSETLERALEARQS